MGEASLFRDFSAAIEGGNAGLSRVPRDRDKLACAAGMTATAPPTCRNLRREIIRPPNPQRLRFVIIGWKLASGGTGIGEPRTGKSTTSAVPLGLSRIWL